MVASAWSRVQILDYLVVNYGVITIRKISKANQTIEATRLVSI
jgi:hypothetical protein